MPLFRALIEGINTALLAILVYLCAVPFLFVAGLGLVIMFLANAYLLSREYFLLAAMRFRPPAEAKAMRRAHRGQIFLAGLLIAMFVSIPIVNLATPLFAMAMMVHMHKRLSQRRVRIISRSGLAYTAHAALMRPAPSAPSCPAICTNRRSRISRTAAAAPRQV